MSRPTQIQVDITFLEIVNAGPEESKDLVWRKLEAAGVPVGYVKGWPCVLHGELVWVDDHAKRVRTYLWDGTP